MLKKNKFVVIYPISQQLVGVSSKGWPYPASTDDEVYYWDTVQDAQNFCVLPLVKALCKTMEVRRVADDLSLEKVA